MLKSKGVSNYYEKKAEDFCKELVDKERTENEIKEVLNYLSIKIAQIGNNYMFHAIQCLQTRDSPITIPSNFNRESMSYLSNFHRILSGDHFSYISRDIQIIENQLVNSCKWVSDILKVEKKKEKASEFSRLLSAGWSIAAPLVAPKVPIPGLKEIGDQIINAGTDLYVNNQNSNLPGTMISQKPIDGVFEQQIRIAYDTLSDDMKKIRSLDTIMVLFTTIQPRDYCDAFYKPKVILEEID